MGKGQKAQESLEHDSSHSGWGGIFLSEFLVTKLSKKNHKWKDVQRRLVVSWPEVGSER